MDNFDNTPEQKQELYHSLVEMIGDNTSPVLKDLSDELNVPYQTVYRMYNNGVPRLNLIPIKELISESLQKKTEKVDLLLESLGSDNTHSAELIKATEETGITRLELQKTTMQSEAYLKEKAVQMRAKQLLAAQNDINTSIDLGQSIDMAAKVVADQMQRRFERMESGQLEDWDDRQLRSEMKALGDYISAVSSWKKAAFDTYEAIQADHELQASKAEALTSEITREEAVWQAKLLIKHERRRLKRLGQPTEYLDIPVDDED
jgi:Mg2+ and Co2+ transporter CorA